MSHQRRSTFFGTTGGSSYSTLYDFTIGALPGGVTLTRASAGYRYNSSGVLVSETTDAARFQYDPVALTARGLLVEDASSGLNTYSEQLDNAAVSKVRASVTANTVVAPDGMTTGDTLVEDTTASNSHDVRWTAAYVSGTTYTHSIFVKANTRSRIFMQLHAAAFTSTLSTWFDISGGTVGTTAAGVTAYIQSVGSGWYRCACIATATATSTQSWIVSMTTGDNVGSYNGDGVSDLYLWGGNVRAGSSITSYVQTVASPVVRAADVALITNASAISDQCWIVKARTPRKISGGAANSVLTVDDGSFYNRRLVYYTTAGTLIAAAVVGNVTTGSMILGSVAADTDFVVAVRWADNNFAASLNGGAIVTDLSGANPLGLTTARVGHADSGSLYWNSTIKTIETRRTATDAELPLLSA